MDEKLVFVADCLRGELPMAALCEACGISRKTGYKWLGRYRDHVPEGLVERSRAPHGHGRSMASFKVRDLAIADISMPWALDSRWTTPIACI